MTNSQRLAAVRQTLRAWFLERHPDAQWEVAESIMIRDAFYCGRNFRFASHRAVWFAEEEQVKIYDADGSLLDSFKTDQLVVAEPRVKLHQPDAEDETEEQQPAEQAPAAEDTSVRRAA